MTASPSLARLNLWQRVRTEILAVVAEAVDQLPPVPAGTGEVEINKELARRIYSVIYERSRRDPDAMSFAPVSDGLNVAMANDNEVVDRKRPDLQWILIDATTSLSESSRSFVVECKRLGSPSAAGYNFNSAYVTNGIARFVHAAWQYGRNADIGVMVGYVQSMKAEAILDEVNRTATQERLPEIRECSATDRLMTGAQWLHRSFRISPFQLRHIWVSTKQT